MPGVMLKNVRWSTFPYRHRFIKNFIIWSNFYKNDIIQIFCLKMLGINIIFSPTSRWNNVLEIRKMTWFQRVFSFHLFFRKPVRIFLCLQIYSTLRVLRAVTSLTVYRSLQYTCSRSLFAKWLRAKIWPGFIKTFHKIK